MGPPRPAAALDGQTPGAPPGYVPQETWLQNLAIAIEITMPALSLVFVLLRAYSRIWSKTLGADDYLVFTAMLFAIAQTVPIVIYIKLAYIGIHVWEIPPHDSVTTGLWAWIANVLYNPILALVKVSVLVFLLRLASIRQAVKIITWINIVFTAGLMLGIILACFLVCQPLQFTWDKSVGGHCVNPKPFGVTTGALTIFTDFTTLAIPFWIFLGLKMNKRVKTALLAVFGLGLIVTIVSIVRLSFLVRNSYFPKEPDSNFGISYVGSAIESNLAIIAACGPALWPLARRVFPRLFSGLGISRGYQGDIESIEITPVLHTTKGSTFTKASSKRSFGSVSEGTAVRKGGDNRRMAENVVIHDGRRCRCGLQLDDRRS